MLVPANSICVNQGYLWWNIFNSLKQYYEKKTAFPPTNRNLSPFMDCHLLYYSNRERTYWRSFNTIHYHFGSFSLYSTIKISQGKRKIIFYPLFSLHFVHIDIFTRIFFIICCIFQFLSIFLHHQKKQEVLINNYKKK